MAWFRHKARIVYPLAFLAFCPPQGIAGEDLAGAKDHPLFGRYEGSNISYFKSSEFDEHSLLKAPLDYASLLNRNALEDRSGAEWLNLEGRVISVRYAIPSGRTSLDVFRNYEQSLTTRGFAVLFSCSNQSCFAGDLKDPYLLGQMIDSKNGVSTAYFDTIRYMLVKFDDVKSTIYGSVLVGEDKDTITAFIEVVETAAMEVDKIKFIDASKMQNAINEHGSVNIYGIKFDFDKDALREDSKPTLAEIGKLLAAKPELKLEIVGHTDDEGTPPYNLDLSSRRAARVVAELVAAYGIDASRLTSRGAGMGSPIASNETDAGRAENRRVELVSKN